jgi:hypothetical protein
MMHSADYKPEKNDTGIEKVMMTTKKINGNWDISNVV